MIYKLQAERESNNVNKDIVLGSRRKLQRDKTVRKRSYTRSLVVTCTKSVCHSICPCAHPFTCLYTHPSNRPSWRPSDETLLIIQRTSDNLSLTCQSLVCASH